MNYFFIATFAIAAAPALEEPLLQITGNLDAPTKAGVEVELSALTRLPVRTVSLKRSWERTPSTFTGPLLRDVLSAYNAKGQTIRARSMGGTELRLPMQYISNNDVVVGFKGVDPVAWSKSNGVLFLVFPGSGSAASAAELAVTAPPSNTFQLQSISVE